MLKNPQQDPISIISEPNGDNTTDYQCGSFSPFNVIVVSNTFASVIPADHVGCGFYSFGETLPSDADVRATR